MQTTTQISMPMDGDDEFVDVDVRVKFVVERDENTRRPVLEIDWIETVEGRCELDVNLYAEDVEDACMQAWADAQHEDPDDVRDRLRDARRDAA